MNIFEEFVVQHGVGQLHVLGDALGAEELKPQAARRRRAQGPPVAPARFVHEAVQLLVDLLGQQSNLYFKGEQYYF